MVPGHVLVQHIQLFQCLPSAQQQAEVSVSRLLLLLVYAVVMCWRFRPKLEHMPSKNTWRMCDPTGLVFTPKLWGTVCSGGGNWGLCSVPGNIQNCCGVCWRAGKVLKAPSEQDGRTPGRCCHACTNFPTLSHSTLQPSPTICQMQLLS